MSDYTPSLSAVRNAYSNGSADRIPQQGADSEFERFIAKIKAEAWEEGISAQQYYELDGTMTPNPYRPAP